MRETDEAISVIRDWLELACSNKNGNGDATGLLPEKSLDMISKLTTNHQHSSAQ